MRQKYVIFQDLDGCITDFQAFSHNMFGEDFECENPKIPLENKIEAVKIVPTFWNCMPWMSDGRILWEYVHRHDPHILSAYAPWDYHRCLVGKHDWICNNLPTIKPTNVHLVARNEKCNYAISSRLNTSHILIDDYDKNIDEWTSAGGIAIQHISASYTIESLQKLGL